jgi:hypothetical protein
MVSVNNCFINSSAFTLKNYIPLLMKIIEIHKNFPWKIKKCILLITKELENIAKKYVSLQDTEKIFSFKYYHKNSEISQFKNKVP